MARYPKLLPWLARRYGLPIALGEKLWRLAYGEAIERREQEPSRRYRWALERFLDLLDDESRRAHGMPARTDFGWFWRHQRRMAAMSFGATSAGCRLWDDYLRRLRAPQHLV